MKTCRKQDKRKLFIKLKSNENECSLPGDTQVSAWLILLFTIITRQKMEYCFYVYANNSSLFSINMLKKRLRYNKRFFDKILSPPLQSFFSAETSEASHYSITISTKDFLMQYFPQIHPFRNSHLRLVMTRTLGSSILTASSHEASWS